MRSHVQSERQAGMVERLEAWWHDWRQRAHERAELRGADSAMLDQIARDTGAASVRELLDVVGQGPRGAALMAEMCKALSIDLQAARAQHPRVVRQLEISCSVCEQKPRCTCELAEGTAAAHIDEFCHNAGDLRTLKS